MSGRLAGLSSLCWLMACGEGLVAVGDPQCANAPDADQDGLCDAVDACMHDPGNDPDNDGICAAADLCPEHADAAGSPDADHDGVPDACDVCPDDIGGDSDGDGICDVDDDCPAAADNVCDQTMIVAVQVDGFPSGMGWKLLDAVGNKVVGGDFARPGDGRYYRVPAQVGDTFCLSLEDAAAENGGIRALVFSPERAERYLAMGFYGWSGALSSTCFTFGEDGKSLPEPPTEPQWLDRGMLCRVDMTVQIGQAPSDMGWALGWSRSPRAALAQVSLADGGYESGLAWATDERRWKLAAGDYVLSLSGRHGDAWRGEHLPTDGGFASIWTLSQLGDRRLIVTADMSGAGCATGTACQREINFTVPDCH